MTVAPVWSPTDCNQYLTVSGATVTADLGFTGYGWLTLRSDTSQKTGLRNVQITVLEIGDGTSGQTGLAVGVANGQASIDAAFGSDTNGCAYGYGGNVLYGGSFQAGPPDSFTTGDVLGIQVDLDNHTVAFNKNGGAYSTPLDISAMGDELFIACELSVNISSPSVRLESSPVYSVPDGAIGWNEGNFTDATVNIVAHGDSITLASVANSIWLSQLADLLSARGVTAQWYRKGINGGSWDYTWSLQPYNHTLIEDATLRVDPLKSSSLPNYLFLFAGTNGAALIDHSAATEYSNFETYIAARLAAGWRARDIYVMTMLPRADSLWGELETFRTAYNAALVAGAATYGYNLIRLDQDATIGQAGQYSDTTYYTGGVHPTDAGHAIIANLIFELFFNLLTINTQTGSPHPVNCQMAGSEPLSKVKHGIIEWFRASGKITVKSKFKSGTVFPVGSTKL